MLVCQQKSGGFLREWRGSQRGRWGWFLDPFVAYGVDFVLDLG